MNIDSNGLPVTINDKGEYDGGDSLANYCRWKIAEYALNKQNPIHLKSLYKVEINQNGLMRRHPGTGFDPKGSPFYNVPDFWTNPKELSRDNSRALHWLIALKAYVTEISIPILERVERQYKLRSSIKAQNNDIMLPFQFYSIGVKTILRDLEILFNVLVQIGLFPIFKDDKPYGFGKEKKIKFTWQDENEVDGDPNLVCDLTAAALLNRTKLLTLCIKLYIMFRGDKAIKHYYRKESGNNEEIGILYSYLIKKEFKI